MEPRVYVHLRRTLDWSDAHGVERDLAPTFRLKYEAWNATFNLTYHRFRHRLRRITDLNLSRIENALVAPLDEIPEGALVVPTDDDDWFSPDLANGLRAAYAPHFSGYLWGHYTAELPRSRLAGLRTWLWLARGNRHQTCGSNSYAVTRSAGHLPLLAEHAAASRFFDAHPRRIRRLPCWWAVRNRSIASQTAMGWRKPTVTREELIASYQRYWKLYDGLRLPTGFGWAEPYVRMMAELMRELEIR